MNANEWRTDQAPYDGTPIIGAWGNEDRHIFMIAVWEWGAWTELRKRFSDTPIHKDPYKWRPL